MHTSFEDRLSRLETTRKATASTPHPKHSLPPASSRRERLSRALVQLDRIGIRGAYAYAPALVGLAKAGLIVKPFFFWNKLLLFVFGFFFFSLLFGGTLAVCLAMGVTPRPIRGMIEAGPLVFLGMMLGLSILWTGWHVIAVRGSDLPSWRDR
jgi:hypothetical protein